MLSHCHGSSSEAGLSEYLVESKPYITDGMSNKASLLPTLMIRMIQTSGGLTHHFQHIRLSSWPGV